MIGSSRRLALRLQIRTVGSDLPSHHILWTVLTGAAEWVSRTALPVFLCLVFRFLLITGDLFQQDIGTDGWTVDLTFHVSFRTGLHTGKRNKLLFWEINHPKKGRVTLLVSELYDIHTNYKSLPVPTSGNHKAAWIGAELNRFQHSDSMVPPNGSPTA